MSSYSRPVPPHLKGPRGSPSKPRPTFSSTAVHPPSALAQQRSKPTHPVVTRPSHHPHSLTVDVSSYAHSVTQPLSPTSPPSGDAKHSPLPRPAPVSSATQYVQPSASLQPLYSAAFPQYVNNVSPHPSYAPPPPHFQMSPYNAHMAYPPHPSHGMAAGPPHPSHTPMFYHHPPTAVPPPPHFHPSQPYYPNYTMYAPPQSGGAIASRGHVHAQSVQLASHTPVVDAANVVSLSLFDDDDGQQHSSRGKPIEEEKSDESARPIDTELAELRATCQQFILALLTNKQNSSTTPPWRSHHDKNNPIVMEYEALYSQMLTLSPSLATQAPTGIATTGRLSTTVTTSPPASSRLSVESQPRMSKERRPSKLSQISSAIRARLSKDSIDSPLPPTSPPSQPQAATTAGDESVMASPRHSFSLLIPSFSTLHAVAKVMQLTKRVRRAKEAGRKEAEEEKEEKQKAEEAEDEDEPNENKPSTAQPVMEDEQHHTRLVINSLQSHSSTPLSTQLSATQPLLSPALPPSRSSPASPSSRSPRVFRSRYNKQQELSQLQQQTSSNSEPVDTAVRKPAIAAFSYTMPLPRAPVKAETKMPEKENEAAVKDKESQVESAKSPSHEPLSPLNSPPAVEVGRASVASKPAHRRNVTFAAPPAKSTTHLRSLSTLPPLPPLPSNLTARNSTASTSAFSKTAPVSPAVARPPTTSTAVVTKPRITHHRFNTPSQPRPLLTRSDPPRQLNSEKLEASEQSDKAARQRKAAEEKRRHRREQLMDKPVKKWGKRGWPHKSRLHITADGQLHWNWKNDDKSAGDGKCVSLKGVRAVVPGLSPVEHKGVAFATSVLCFSVLGAERVLGCECASVRERDDWMEELRVDVGEAKTRGCVWSGRVMMSIDRDPSIECIVAEEDKNISFI